MASARRAAGLTQREVAELVDTNEMQVSKWERGIHRPVDGTLMLLAFKLDRDFAWFFVDHDIQDVAA